MRSSTRGRRSSLPTVYSGHARLVVGGVLLSRDELLGVVELAVGAGADLVDDGRLEVNEHGAGHVCFPEPVSENKVLKASSPPRADGLVRGHLAVGLNAVLEAVKFPARVTAPVGHRPGPHVDRNNLAHLEMKAVVWFEERCAKCLAICELEILRSFLSYCVSPTGQRGGVNTRGPRLNSVTGGQTFSQPQTSNARVSARTALCRTRAGGDSSPRYGFSLPVSCGFGVFTYYVAKHMYTAVAHPA
jgi:hypothetical protein